MSIAVAEDVTHGYRMIVMLRCVIRMLGFFWIVSVLLELVLQQKFADAGRPKLQHIGLTHEERHTCCVFKFIFGGFRETVCDLEDVYRMHFHRQHFRKRLSQQLRCTVQCGNPLHGSRLGHGCSIHT